MQIILIVGALQAGKTTAAMRLVEAHGFSRVRFADTIKAMLRTMGVPETAIEGQHRDQPLDMLCGKNARFALQTLGTEWGRRTIGEDVWVNVLLSQLGELGDRRYVVIDDARFPNECQRVIDTGMDVRVLRVRREAVEAPRWARTLARWTVRVPGVNPLLARFDRRLHVSELYWDQVPADAEVSNNQPLNLFLETIDKLMEHNAL